MQTSRFVGTLAITMVVGLLMSNVVSAQEDYTYSSFSRNRAQSWEFFIPISYALGTSIDGQNGSGADIDDDLGMGFGFGYNVSDHFRFGGLFNWNSRNYEAKTVGDDGSTRNYSDNLEVSTFLLNGTYYILPGRITPFVTGSIGYSFFDTNIPSGLPTSACYWDPWWGYSCYDYVPTKTQDGVSSGVSIGLRYDVNENFGLQLSYNRMWFDLDNISSTPEFDSVSLDFILRKF